MSPSLGEKLRQAREERGISISEVAEQTRISSLYLKSIEDDNYKPLPGGIFNKGFVRAYAKYVGIDEQEALQDYARLAAQAEPQIEDQQPRYRPDVLTDERSMSSLLPTIVFAGIILALMTGGILFVVSYIQNQSDTPAPPSNSNQTAGQAVEPTPTPPADVDEIRVEFRAMYDPISVSSTVDGATRDEIVQPTEPKTYVGRQSIRLRYYKGFVDKAQITLNGKQITPPPAPAKGNLIDFEINRDNISTVLTSGQIAPALATAPAATATPAARPPVTPARPPSTPRRTPTPIVVGSPPARPSPE